MAEEGDLHWPLVAVQFRAARAPVELAAGLQLRAAVMCNAVREAQGRPAETRDHRRLAGRARRLTRIQADALAWFASDDVTWPYSFLNICQALQLSARHIRARLPQLDTVPMRAGYRSVATKVTAPRATTNAGRRAESRR